MPEPLIARTPEELRAATSGTVALVPTMGALHAGHLSLMEHVRPLADTVVTSIFLNPTQFAPGEDFDEYPRTFDADVQKCATAGVDVIFAPTVDVMYPAGLDGTVRVDPGPLGRILEGEHRPVMFRGVLTVVAKLFGLVRPDIAIFGEKDYQQLTLIRLMAEELCLGVEVLGGDTVREEDGLAMSSRNAYLAREERALAASIAAALRAGIDAAAGGEAAALDAARAVLTGHGIEPDYLVVTDPDLGEARPGEAARMLVAARVGSTRLLDNVAVRLGGSGTV
ncbi:pantoate--beta-alanine ligase [Brevibacterium jeotgali]|uniref:Pantothenate synthetase n=1 Tax=Brevibacterium jeotgali TaxID=1262550 RepID=A0A2H1L526_9MICO|nr:pantoate--beta-alanine ligase [Brevibacterium jeotgali]TWC01399.1 pantothenate synthetase [Brevibacterium jeotgali]SMY11996.1 pantothenate synthetase [Brevibacterium jeotgali]